MPPRTLRWRNLIPGGVMFGVLLVASGATLKFARIGALHGSTIHYFASFPSARDVMGGTEVWINGAKVGRVKRVSFAPPSADTSNRVVVEFEVLEKFREQIRENSTAQLRTGAQLMGPMVLYLTAGSNDARIVPERDTIRGTAGADVQNLTQSFGEVAHEFPALMSDVKVLTSSLASARGTIGALTTLDAPKRFETLLGNATRLTDRATSGTGTLALAVQRGELIARAQAASARFDSLRTLLASDRTSFGRFRRDSTLLWTAAELRDELSITSKLLAQQSGTLARFSQDSIIAVEMAEMSKQMTDLFADIRKRPFRYIAF